MLSGLLKRLLNWRNKAAAASDDLRVRIAHHFDASESPILYHYTSASAALGILTNQEFWLSDFSRTNDGSEFIYSRDHFIRCYQNRRVFIEETPRFLNTINLINLERSASMMIGCLTDRMDDFGLWGQYADQSRGCMIGFDAQWLQNRAGVAIRRVNYDLEYLERFVEIGLMMLQSEYEKSPGDHAELDMLSKFYLLDLFAFKDARFQFESEVRVSRLVFRGEETGKLYDAGGHRTDGKPTPALPVLTRNGPYGPTDFVKIPLSDELGSAIRSIRFGPHISDADRLEILEVVRTLRGVETFESDLPLRLRSAD